MEQNPAEDVVARIGRIENGLIQAPTLRGEAEPPASLAVLMAIHQVPGVSVAVIDEGRIAWARGWGAREVGMPDPVMPDTLFQAASISKPVTALAALQLVQEGRLDLDGDVNDRLVSWKIPANGAWQPRVTLRHLLCHGGGVTVHWFPGYNRKQPRPTLVQVLNGERPANTRPVRVNAIPGTQFRYAGGGTTIVQQLLLDVTGQPFPELMRERIFAPLGMTQSTYEQPLPEEREGQAAVGHRLGGAPVDGQWHVFPEMAAAGLWTTPSDLARLALAVQQIRAGQESPLLGKALVDEMLTPQVEPHIGLGFFLGGSGPALHFAHGGDNDGYKARLHAYADGGQGAVIMTNGDLGEILVEALLRAIAQEYGWPQTPGDPWPQYVGDRTAVPVAPRIYQAVTGAYRLKPGYRFQVEATADTLTLQPPGQPPIPLIPRSETEWIADAVDTTVRFVPGKKGKIKRLIVQQNDRELVARKTKK